MEVWDYSQDKEVEQFQNCHGVEAGAKKKKKGLVTHAKVNPSCAYQSRNGVRS